ncbi:PFD2 protein, partial [Poecile atricapillus]|nr:PFD2 protein [Poecile atricapillus]
QVVSRFNRLRQDQRGLASKAAELELELNEHRSPSCSRLFSHFSHFLGFSPQISKLIEALAQQLQAKGRELSEFRERHNIRLVGEDDPKAAARDGPEGSKGGPGGVLVS